MSKSVNIQYPKNWNSEAITTYFTQSSREKTKEQFLKTHVPINRIFVEEDKIFRSHIEDGSRRPSEEDELYVTEEDILEVVTASTVGKKNRLFFLVGETGCGKSELCQWLEYKISDDRFPAARTNEFDHVPIHIPRQVREPREVLQRLAEHLKVDFSSAGTLKELYPDGVYEKTLGTIKTDQFTTDQEITHELLNDDEFEAELESNLKEFVGSFEETDIEFEPIEEDKLEELVDDYPGIANEHDVTNENFVDYFYKTITTGAKRAIQDMLKLGDLKTTLEDLNEQFTEAGKRPVLIIEDLTAFTIFQHELLAFFSDLGAANWDVVIGMTTGLNDRLVDGRRADRFTEDTINDRIQARLVMTRREGDASKTLFLEQEGVYLDLAKQYLDAIKRDGFDPPLPKGIDSDVVNRAFGGYYPFNEAFLTRIYENLKEKDDRRKQTPRIFLKFVLEDLLTNDHPPWEAVELVNKLGTIENRIDPDYDEEDVRVLKWYGRVNEQEKKQVVDDRIAATFRIQSDGEAPISTKEITAGGGSNPPEQPTDPVDPRVERYEDLENELLAWIRDNEPFRQTDALETGGKRALGLFFDNPGSLVHRECAAPSGTISYISWDKGSGAASLIHVDNGDAPNYRKVILDQDIETSVLQDLLELGVFDDEPIMELAQDGRIELQPLKVWATRATKVYRQGLQEDIEAKFGVSLDEIAIFGKYLLNLYTGGSADFTVEALAAPVDASKIEQSAVPQRLDSKLGWLENNAETLVGLFRARFHLRENVVNRSRLESFIEQHPKGHLFDSFHKAESGVTGFRLGPNKSSSSELQNFVKKLRSYARDLNEYRSGYEDDLEAARSGVKIMAEFYSGAESLRDIDFDAIRSAYEHTDFRPPRAFDDLSDAEDEKYQEVREKVTELANEFDSDLSLPEFLLAFREVALIKYKDLSTVYKSMAKLPEELEELHTDLSRFVEEGRERTFDPDKTEFENARSEAGELARSLEETL